MEDEFYMRRCLELAECALGKVAPNPLVGSLFVYNNRIIAEGFHMEFGKSHAEVNTINQIREKEFLTSGTLYVNLEPCSHFGKTPPCTDLIISKGISKVIIANKDPFPKVNGAGIQLLKQAGIKVTTGILENEAAMINRRFFTFHLKKRPYIILKWAQSADGFISPADPAVGKIISSEASRLFVHKWRSEEQAIMIGKNTALTDNPSLTTRMVKGRNPIRIIAASDNSLPAHLNIFDDKAPTIILNKKISHREKNVEYVQIESRNNFLDNFFAIMYDMQIQSVLVEGGTELLNTFINNDAWDEARVFTSRAILEKGVKAPVFNMVSSQAIEIENDTLNTYFNLV
jgi:diaminohydroxyphosphoribosylaminopyrimidine deaminase / 5-amino-6-(5-phosphoribosylamino)uracil reductase